MNKVTKEEREKLLAKAKEQLAQGGYDPEEEFQNSPSDYTQAHSGPVIDYLMSEYEISRDRSRGVAAKALRQLRYKIFKGWQGGKDE